MASVASTVENFGAMMAFIVLLFFGLQFRLFDLWCCCLLISLGYSFLVVGPIIYIQFKNFRLTLALVGKVLRMFIFAFETPIKIS
jgi:hypothetical protein